MEQDVVTFQPRLQNYLLLNLFLLVVLFTPAAIRTALFNRPIRDTMSHVAFFAAIQLAWVAYDVLTRLKRLRLQITQTSISGPSLFGRTTFSLESLDQQKTITRGFFAKLGGDMHIRSTETDKWIYINAFEFGKDQVEAIYGKLGLPEPVMHF